VTGTQQFWKLLAIFAAGCLIASHAFAQYGYETPGSTEQPQGQIIEKSSNYWIKTTRSRQNLCRIMASQDQQLLNDSMGFELAVKDCLETVKFEAYRQIFFATSPTEKTLTKTFVKSTGGMKTCDYELKRIFEHFKVEDSGRLVKVSGHWEPLNVICN